MAHDHHDHQHSGHHRGHQHASGHSHAPGDFGWAFAVGTALNLLFVVIETASGFLANSMALLADAGHNLSDVFALLIAWTANSLARRAPTPRYTYGLGSSSILAALANAVILLVAVGAIAVEAVQRFGRPEPVAGFTVMVVAGVGIVINGVTAWMFARGRKSDLNVRGAYLHMVADAAVSLGVVLAGLAILLTGWTWLDPLVSLAIAGVIVWGTWGLLRDSVNMALHGVPAGIDPRAVRLHLEQVPGVASIHDLHIWPMSTTETALTCHLVMPQGSPGDAFLAAVARSLHDRFGISHATLQVEKGESACALEPDHVV
ncbi:MAG: cation diffusion facilitator family transporter [Hyphomicrobiaceae bacterium]